MKMLFAAVALATLVATPALAQSFGPGRLEGPTVGPHGEIQISAARAAALRQCSEEAAKYPEYLWGNTESYLYRACMTEHGEVE